MGLGNYILKGHEAVRINDTLEWAKWFESANRKVAKDSVEGTKIEVSTVFLGLDHNFSQVGPPVLFETMVFGLLDSEEVMDRYETWEAAEVGHAKILADMENAYGKVGEPT